MADEEGDQVSIAERRTDEPLEFTSMSQWREALEEKGIKIKFVAAKTLWTLYMKTSCTYKQVIKKMKKTYSWFGTGFTVV